ncbi:PH domain-containing protein [Nocardia arthritidis]|uniref:PH domain-containing protein n=1 Tax=Nocardia arthritidis TaxID=228602 RepID=A0A6G9Y891_9NOCA|nr:PH domain-containing protein [Nocardia arthritidis]QIS09273.1 PH domain-containing protein [Nocardia arthritidis]
MGYPEDVLAPDEHLILHRHPHWKMLFWPVVTLVVVTALAGFGEGLASRKIEGGARMPVLIAILAVWLIIVVWRCAARIISWKSTHFIITDRRVLIRQGVLTHTGIDIPISRISSVQFRHGLFDRMLGTGTLIIESASVEPLEYDDIPNVEKVHALLYHQVFDTDRAYDNGGRRTRDDNGGYR